MAYAGSVQSTSGTLAGYARKMAGGGRADMSIILDDHTPGKIYTTFDALSGRVEITAPHTARFDEIHISLEGTIKTFVENVSPHSTRARTSAHHNFLKLVMPISESAYPIPRIAEAGQTYIFPFNFVIPNQLLPRACSHRCVDPSVHQAHLQLPPSMGGTDIRVLDDLAPAMAKVLYAIRVRVVRNREVDNMDVVLSEGKKKLCVIPATPELPPLATVLGEDDYVLSKSKSLKKGMFSGKLGRITVSTVQPGALTLPTPASGNSATTMAELRLRFDPRSESSQPPKLGGLTTKLKVSTFYAARAASALPSRVGLVHNYAHCRSVYESTVALSSRCVESVSWSKRAPAPAYTRRSSNTSTSSSDCDSECEGENAKAGAEYYEASILVPITLPTSKDWIPTFHSCITSRVYAIELSLSIHTPGTGVPASNVTLCVPVQVAQSTKNATRPVLTAEEAAAELAQVDEYLRPRVIEVPGEELIGNSVLAHASRELPPSYEPVEQVGLSRQVIDPGRS